MISFVSETDPIPEPLLSVDEVATQLRVTPQRVRQLIADGALEAERVGRSWIMRKSDVDRARPATTMSVILPTTSPAHQSGLTSLSFFSGAMGLDLGLERAGIHTRLACESDKWARRTIAENRPDIPVLGDIWKYSADDIVALAGLAESEGIDLIAGGPPCQAFSTAGSRRGFGDVRGNVFLHFIDLIEQLQPRYAVIENVRGLLSMPVAEGQAQHLREETGLDFSGKHGAIRLVAHRLRSAGYNVSFNLYNSANFGTPQIRERVVIIAAREGGTVQYLQPTRSADPKNGLPSWRTVREVFDEMPFGDRNYLPFPESRLKYYRMLEAGQYWKHLPIEIQQEAMGKSFFLGGGRTGFYRRISWDRPSPTLVTHPAMPATDLGHPTEDRPLSIEEYKRIQEFPDDWLIQGDLKQQYKQVGNAVPLGLGEAIGRAIVAHSRGELRSTYPDFQYSRYRETSDADILSPAS